MEMAPWVSSLTADQLQEPYRRIATEIGVRNTVILAQMYQGTPLYFPKFDSVISDVRNRRIREEYQAGAGYKELAIRYGITERWVYEIIGSTEDENQTSLF